MTEDKIKGSVLALAMGDALGAAYEGGVLEKTAWKAIGKHRGKCRWTDDTQMSIDIMESLVANGAVNQDDIANRFANSYEWSRGYGPGAAKILKKIKKGMPWENASRSVYKDGSYGNGAAMRVGPIGLFFADQSVGAVVEAATKTAVITHAHPLGVEGAVLVALATARAFKDDDTASILTILGKAAADPVFQEKLQVASDWLLKTAANEVSEVRAVLGNGIAAQDSVISAIYCALSHRERSFEDLLDYIRTLGGDVDTIGAMAGAIWGAARGAGALPENQLQRVEQYDYIEDLAARFANAING
ncbi:MAG: hypothetical protein GY854_10835 [Deltaproteobacteria bacterium]|nr:hypothetical protein [Deltaproteobacteria bacterium]